MSQKRSAVRNAKKAAARAAVAPAPVVASPVAEVVAAVPVAASPAVIVAPGPLQIAPGAGDFKPVLSVTLNMMGFRSSASTPDAASLTRARAPLICEIMRAYKLTDAAVGADLRAEIAPDAKLRIINAALATHGHKIVDDGKLLHME